MHAEIKVCPIFPMPYGVAWAAALKDVVSGANCEKMR